MHFCTTDMQNRKVDKVRKCKMGRGNAKAT